MPQLNSVTTSDDYTGSASLGPVQDSSGGYATISDADVFAQFQYGARFEIDDTDEVHVPVGSLSLPKGVEGARFRSFTPGVPATVTCVLFYPVQPPVQIQAGGPSPTPTSPLAIVSTGQQTAASGTPTSLVGGSTPCVGVSVEALAGNTGKVYVGAAGVGSGDGYELPPGAAIGFDVADLVGVFFVTSISGDGVSWLAVG